MFPTAEDLTPDLYSKKRPARPGLRNKIPAAADGESLTYSRIGNGPRFRQGHCQEHRQGRQQGQQRQQVSTILTTHRRRHDIVKWKNGNPEAKRRQEVSTTLRVLIPVPRVGRVCLRCTQRFNDSSCQEKKGLRRDARHSPHAREASPRNTKHPTPAFLHPVQLKTGSVPGLPPWLQIICAQCASTWIMTSSQPPKVFTARTNRLSSPRFPAIGLFPATKLPQPRMAAANCVTF